MENRKGLKKMSLDINICRECIKRDGMTFDGVTFNGVTLGDVECEMGNDLVHVLISKRSDENGLTYTYIAKFAIKKSGYKAFKYCTLNFSCNMEFHKEAMGKSYYKANSTAFVPNNLKGTILKNCEPCIECPFYAEHLLNTLNSKENK
mgnify:CR=1 FL=1